MENEELQAWETVMPLEDSEQNGEAGLREGRSISFDHAEVEVTARNLPSVRIWEIKI